eukprot:scaffold11009_cov103-Isochrysis_galbana.AAC.4
MGLEGCPPARVCRGCAELEPPRGGQGECASHAHPARRPASRGLGAQAVVAKTVVLALNALARGAGHYS